MDNFRRRFSTLKQRMSFTDGESSPPSKIRQKINNNSSRRNTNNNNNMSSNSVDTQSVHSAVEPEQLNQRTSYNSQNFTLGTSSTKAKMMQNPMHETLPMPSHEEIEKLFEQVLDEMAIPKANQAPLRAQDDKKKWALIQAHNKYQPTSKSTTPEYWIEFIQKRTSSGRPLLSVNDALSLQSVFRTSHREFLLDFLELDGVSALNRLLDFYTGLEMRTKDEEQILGYIIESYRLLMNNEVGMEGVLLIPGSIRSIAMAMDYINGNDALTEKVILLLSVACWWSEAGRQQVMEAMKYVKARRREISKFQTIVFLFEFTTDISFKASIATFVTTVCNTPPNIEGRVKVRNDFFTLDIIKVFDRILSRANMGNTQPSDEENWNNIQTQFEVFVTMMRQDQKEIVHKMIRAADEDESHFDLSNLNESWKIIQRNAHRSDCQDQLLNVIQALYLIPNEHTLAVPIYESIIKYIFEATSFDKIGQDPERKMTDPPELNFAELGKLFNIKVERDAKIQQSYGKQSVIKRQQRIIKIMQRRLVDVANGKVDPKSASDLSNLLLDMDEGKGFGIGGGSKTQGTAQNAGDSSAENKIDVALLSGLGLTETANEIEIMKERENKLKAEIEKLEKEVAEMRKGKPVGLSDPNSPNSSSTDDIIKSYKGKLDSTGLVPAGIAPGKTKKDPPPVPGIGMPGSLENAPIKVERKKPLADLGFSANATTEGKPEVNKPGGLEALFAAKAGTIAKKPNQQERNKEILQKLGLPDKKPIKPKTKMTHVFWSVVPPDSLEGTIWVELSDQEVKFDPNELEKLFGKKSNNDTMKKTKKSMDGTGTMKQELTKLIDPQRRQNLGIALKKIRLKNKDIKNAIVSIDDSILTPQLVQVLMDTVPTADEATLIEKYLKDGGEPNQLAYEERYLMEVSEIPDLSDRLQCIKTKHTFAYDARRILNIIQLSKAAIKEVNSSTDLRQILEIVLAVGNYMNGGTARGQAWGFKLDVLGKLITIKDAINNGTLMHYLYVLFERNYRNLLEFSLPLSAKVVSVSMKDLANEMNALAKNVQLIRNELKKTRNLKGDNFSKVMNPFEVRASKDVQRLQNDLEKVRTDFHNLALKFAESGPTVEPNSFFPKLVEFEQNLKRAGAQIEQMRGEAERRKHAEEQKLERQTVLKLKKLVEATRDKEGNIDLGLIQQFKKAQSGATRQVVDRFMDKYKNDQEREKKMRKMKQRGDGKFLDE